QVLRCRSVGQRQDVREISRGCLEERSAEELEQVGVAGPGGQQVAGRGEDGRVERLVKLLPMLGSQRADKLRGGLVEIRDAGGQYDLNSFRALNRVPKRIVQLPVSGHIEILRIVLV